MADVSYLKTTTMPSCFYLLSLLLYAFIPYTDDVKIPEPIPDIELKNNIVKNIRGIFLPQGFSFVDDHDSSYGAWLLDLKFKQDNKVYLYNGNLKSNQDIHYGVLDIAIGKKDLVQCADAAIKLRADYLFGKHRYDQIRFTATSGDEISFDGWLKGIRWKEKRGRLVSYNIYKSIMNIQNEYNAFMEIVFSYCGTYSLSNQLKTVNGLNSIKPGDIFVEGGFPGHAVTVMAVAKNNLEQRIFILSQGYMPAQDVHILKNLSNPELSPWYDISGIYPLYTPQWQFGKSSLKHW